MTAILFVIMSLGIIGLSRYLLYLLIFAILFPILVDYYLSNPGKFHYQFGLSTEMLENMPTCPAEEMHVSDCIICADSITVGQEIMVLRCSGRHFYHSQCIRDWLKVKFSCPLCKSYNII